VEIEVRFGQQWQRVAMNPLALEPQDSGPSDSSDGKTFRK
jgi:hypothetical protein